MCFYQYDVVFDKIDGLFNAIYYQNEKLLKKYKERLSGAKFAIAPDYSQCGDVPKIENLYRLFKSRIVSLWLLLELDIIVIPNITYANDNYFDVMLDGMENTEVVAFSVKGAIREPAERKLLQKAIKVTVDGLEKLKKIIVYSVSTDDRKVLDIFQYATSKGINVIIPDNILRERNIILKEDK